MATSPHDPSDPMVREVDRLLAQLAASGAQPVHDSVPRDWTPTPASASKRRPTPPRPARSAPPPLRRNAVALWARVFLGAVFGGLMTQWPYPHRCDLPLLGYLAAVAMVMLTGTWIAFVSWKLRSGMAHLLALALFFWGIVLAAEQVLPRVGYAAQRASWRCSTQMSILQ